MQWNSIGNIFFEMVSAIKPFCPRANELTILTDVDMAHADFFWENIDISAFFIIPQHHSSESDVGWNSTQHPPWSWALLLLNGEWDCDVLV